METVIANPDTQVAVINNSIELFRTAPEILKANQNRSEKALVVGNSIIDQWSAAWEIKDEGQRMAALAKADERSNHFLANCSTANKEMKEARAAITQMMDVFKKMFTSAENDIDKSKKDSIASKVQVNRDNYASEVHKLEERRRREAEQKAAKAKEAVEIKADLAKNLNEQFMSFLLKAKQWLQSQFNDLSLTNFADDAAQIRLYEPHYKESVFNKIVLYTSVPCSFHNDEDLRVFVEEVKNGKYEPFSDQYKKEMLALKHDLVDKIPSKHEELKEQKRLADEAAEAAKKAAEAKSKADKEAAEKRAKEAAERARIAEEQRKEREAIEAKRMEEEAEAARKKAKEEVELKKQGEQTMVMFEQEAALAGGDAGPEARQGYEIEVLHPAGYVQIFQHWFESEGRNLPVDKIGKTKMDQMKAWCEKNAHKTGEKIESKFLKYNASFKAINRK